MESNEKPDENGSYILSDELRFPPLRDPNRVKISTKKEAREAINKVLESLGIDYHRYHFKMYYHKKRALLEFQLFDEQMNEIVSLPKEKQEALRKMLEGLFLGRKAPSWSVVTDSQ